MEAITLEILDQLFELRFADKCYLPLAENLKPFIVSDYSISSKKTVIEIGDESFNGFDGSQHLARCHKSLSMVTETDGHLFFNYHTGQFLANRDFSHIKLWLPFEKQMSLDHGSPINYSGDPSLRLIVWACGSIDGFCYMHGALVVVDSKYILLVGSSGTGKTTLSGLACDGGATCLTEEDPFLAMRDNRVMAYGTPWPGIKGPDVSFSGELSAIFFIRHAGDNEINALTIDEVSQLLLVHSRTFNWLPKTIPSAIEIFNAVARDIPCYDLGFVPDHTSVKAILDIL